MSLRRFITLVENLLDPTEGRLAAIRDEAESLGMELDVVFDGQTIHIDLIRVPSDLQQRGLGSHFMWKIIDLADELEVPVTLEAQSFDDLEGDQIEQDVLERWYRKFGFGDTGEESEFGNPILLRHPEPLTEAGKKRRPESRQRIREATLAGGARQVASARRTGRPNNA